MWNKKNDIIILALAMWDGPYASTALALARELSRNTRVFYVDNPISIKKAIRHFRSKQVQSRIAPLFLGMKPEKQIDQNNSNLINVRPLLVLPLNFLSAGKLYNFVSKINNYILKQAIRSVIKRHGLKDYIIINSFNPFYLADIKNLNPALSIYHCVDNISESKHIFKHGKRLEEIAMGNYDVTLTTSKNLFEKASGFSKKVFRLPNAADFNHFRMAATESFERPEELRGLENKKIIGYIGNICLRINYALVRRISESHPDKILLLIGPVTDQEFYRYKLDQQQNIVLTGKKPYQDLPRYLQFMDCTIIPFKCNELTRNIYPLKLNEYLAAGKPVVTTDFSPDLDDFGTLIQVENSIEAFVHKVSEEIATDNEQKRERRISVAKKNSWSSRAEDFWLNISPLIRNIEKDRYVRQEN